MDYIYGTSLVPHVAVEYNLEHSPWKVSPVATAEIFEEASSERLETSAAKSQGKPKMIEIEGKNDVCLSGSSFVTEAARIVGLSALFERADVCDSNKLLPLWVDTPLGLELWASEVWHYLEISPK